MNFDVVICGGGPAGIAAAIILSRAGVSTLLIEKHFYPREKTCAGILTSKTLDLLEDKFSFPKTKLTFSSNQVSIMYKRKSISQFTVQYPFTFAKRCQFDSMLLELCLKEFTCIMEGLTIKQLFPSENKILLSNDQCLSYKCLIFADGVFSSAYKNLGLQPLPQIFCIQDTIKRNLCPAPLKQLQELKLNFGDVQLGYSWIVPYQTDIVIGTGMFIKQVEYSDLFAKHEILCKKLGLPCLAKRKGAFIPIGEVCNQTEYPYENIVIIGDAAGLVNPLTGEGIYHAILSGYYAGKSYLQNSHEFKQTYLSFLQPVIAQLSEQKKLLSKIYNPFLLENIFYQFKDYPEYWETIFDEVVSSEKKTYNSFLIELQQLLR